MKAIVENTDGDRIVRYGVGDFQINDGEVVLFYPTRVSTTTEAPESESIEGELTGGVCGLEDEDPAYRAEDWEYEQTEADDLKDYRVDYTV